MDADGGLKEKGSALWPYLNERQRRLFLAVEAHALGPGGVARVARASGVSRPTIQQGLRELTGAVATSERVRRVGGGRKSLVERDPTLLAALEALVAPDTRGDPLSPLRWTCKSTRQLAGALRGRGHRVGYRTVAALLDQAGDSLQAAAKTLAGRQPPDRDAQFRYLNDRVKGFLATGQPVVSVDAKKKALVGACKNGGQEGRPKGRPEVVNVHDFPDKEVGKAIPSGVYDVGRNAGWVTVGRDHDTATFAVASLRRWWPVVGVAASPGAERLLIGAAGGGSNGSRVRLWKVALQHFADDSGLAVTVCHLPPGTSKWNKLEHRLVAHSSMNWRGRPLVSHEVIVELIGATTTRAGLRVQAELDPGPYPTKVQVSDEELARVNLTSHASHGEWNYTITPRPPDDLYTLFLPDSLACDSKWPLACLEEHIPQVPRGLSSLSLDAATQEQPIHHRPERAGHGVDELTLEEGVIPLSAEGAHDGTASSACHRPLDHPPLRECPLSHGPERLHAPPGGHQQLFGEPLTLPHGVVRCSAHS